VVWSAVVGLIVALVVGAASLGWVGGDRMARQATLAVVARESLNAARALSNENRPAAARQKLAEARARFRHGRGAVGSLAAEVEAGEAELDRFQQFLGLIDRAHQAETAPRLEAVLAAGGSDDRAARRPVERGLWVRRPAAAVPFLLEALALYEVLE